LVFGKAYNPSLQVDPLVFFFQIDFQLLTGVAMPKQKAVQTVLLTTLALNLTVAVGKILLGLFTGALAITADGFHSITDSAGNVAGLVALRLANRPADHNHPYGHRRFESLAALLIGALLLLTAWEIVKGLFERLQMNQSPEISPLSFAVMFGTLVINLLVSRYQIAQGNALKSEILLADAQNTSADVFVTLSVMLSMVLVSLTGWLWIDTIAAFFVVLLIGKAGWGILRKTGSLLVDTAPYEQEELSAIVGDMGEVVRARSRGSRDAAHIDIDLKVPAEMTIAHSEKLACTIRQRLENKLEGVAEVEVHFMPQ
jgi:cation diffusion facilitator family transporter